MSDPETPFDAAERRALAAWDAPGAPPGFAERVLAAHDRGRARRRSGLLALAAVALLGIGLAAAALTGSRAAEGALAAGAARATAQLGDRGVAVAEPGAALTWREEAGGDAVVEQTGGAVFYRVEPGGAFVVRVPGGEVRVRGTCFDVEVDEMDRVGAAASGALLGAAVAAVVTITVYEGKVEAVSGGAARAVTAGESARFGPGEPPVVGASTPRPGASSPVVVAERPVARARTGGAPADPGVPAAAGGPGDGDGGVATALASARAENERLRAQVKALEVKAREADRLHDEHGMYDLSQAELDRMAERCELRWDTVPYRLGEPLRLPDEDAAELGLSPAQHAAVDAALQKESAYLVSTIREAYVTLTGDDPQAILSVAPSALFDEVEDKTAIEERRRVYQLLSAERARGDASRLDAAALAALSPYERMYRAVTSSGDRLMAALREAIGPDLARSLRDLHDGFGSRSRSMVGCPGQGDE